MKRLFNIAGTVEDNISYWHLAIFLAMLPFDFFYSQLVMVSFAAHTLIHLRRERLRLLFTRPVAMVMAVYVLGLLGMLYSHDRAAAWDLAGRQSAILIWPILLTLTNLPLVPYTLRLLRFFAWVVVGTILYLYIDAFRIIAFYHMPLKSILSQAFMNHQFSLPVGIHATYISLYAALGFVVLLQGLLLAKARASQVLNVIGLAILALGLLQLSSRAVCIALLVIVNTVFPRMMLQGKKRGWFLGISLMLTLAAGLFINNTAAFKTRYFTELKQDVSQQQKMDYDITEPRIERWKLAWQLVQQKPLIGHGSGSELRLLKAAYFEHKLYSSYLNEFNAHNQYLSFLIKTGFAGLLVYLYVLGYGAWVAIRQRHLFLAAFLCMLIIVSVGENILDVNKGIFFYGFFMSLFLLPWVKRKEATQ